jgi:hypothetical protein
MLLNCRIRDFSLSNSEKNIFSRQSKPHRLLLLRDWSAVLRDIQYSSYRVLRTLKKNGLRGYLRDSQVLWEIFIHLPQNKEPQYGFTMRYNHNPNPTVVSQILLFEPKISEKADETFEPKTIKTFSVNHRSCQCLNFNNSLILFR